MASSWINNFMRPMTKRNRVSLTAALCAVGMFVASGCASRSRASAPGINGDRLEAELATLRSATKRFHQLDSAVAAGYPREVPECLIHEHHGAMGYHHVNRAYMSREMDVSRPQILLYERMADSSYRLNGVEFIIPYRLWPRDSVAPVLMGQTLHREPEDLVPSRVGVEGESRRSIRELPP